MGLGLRGQVGPKQVQQVRAEAWKESNLSPSLRGFLRWKMETETSTFFCPVDAQGKLLSGLPGMSGWWEGWETYLPPTPSLLLLGKTALLFAKGGVPPPRSLAVWAYGEMSPTRMGRVMPRCAEDIGTPCAFFWNSAPCRRKSRTCESDRTGFKLGLPHSLAKWTWASPICTLSPDLFICVMGIRIVTSLCWQED